MPTNKLVINLVLIFAGSIVLSACGQSDQESNSSTDENSGVTPRDSLTILLTGADSATVFDLLRLSHQVDYQSTTMGVFVRAIDSIYSSDNYFWVYSVNDSMAKTAADKYFTSDGDTIVWHFRRVGQ